MANNKQDKIPNVPNKRAQRQIHLNVAERAALGPKGNVPNKRAQRQTRLNVPALRFPEFEGEWKSCRITDFGKVVTGNTPSTANKENYENGTNLWASPSDLGDKKYIDNTKIKISDKGYTQTRILPKDSILVTCIGTIGKMGMARKEMATNQQINSIIVNLNFDKDFVYYTIMSRFPKYLSFIAIQVVPILSKSSFEKLENNYPSIREQRKIGKFLDLIDDRIATQRKIIEKLESLMSGIAVSLTTKKPNTKIVDCLSCHSSTLQENQVSSSGKYQVYGANGVCGFTDQPEVKTDSILIVKDGSGVGTVRYAEGAYSVTGTSNFLTAKEGYLLRYLYYCLMCFNFTPYKTGMAIPHIYFKDYGKAKIYCPDIEVQKRIAMTLSKIESKIENEKTILHKYIMQKRHLLQQMFI